MRVMSQLKMFKQQFAIRFRMIEPQVIKPHIFLIHGITRHLMNSLNGPMIALAIPTLLSMLLVTRNLLRIGLRKQMMLKKFQKRKLQPLKRATGELRRQTLKSKLHLEP